MIKDDSRHQPRVLRRIHSYMDMHHTHIRKHTHTPQKNGVRKRSPASRQKTKSPKGKKNTGDSGSSDSNGGDHGIWTNQWAKDFLGIISSIFKESCDKHSEPTANRQAEGAHPKLCSRARRAVPAQTPSETEWKKLHSSHRSWGKGVEAKEEQWDTVPKGAQIIW